MHRTVTLRPSTVTSSDHLKLSYCPLGTISAILVTALLAFLLSGCTGGIRLPALPIESSGAAAILDIPDARFYANRDNKRIAKFTEKLILRRSRSDSSAKEFTFLAISGGGENGAFGAGLLAGWSQHGTRPHFDVVTGISTGALTAPFAFLGSDYDDQMRAVYTKIGPDDIFEKRAPVSSILLGEAMTDTSPLRDMILSQMSDEFVQRIAQEYSKGRLLLVLTTNLDQARAVIWNIGAIAQSSHPRKRELIVDILLASAAIPGAFPPVMLDVTAGGKRHQEMHVDGGLVAQSFLYPSSYSPKHLKRQGLHKKLPKKRVAYVIRNGREKAPEKQVRRKTLDILKSSVSTMIASSGVNDTYRIFLTTKRDGIKFRLAHIKSTFGAVGTGQFDRKYMNALYQYGYGLGRNGYSWRETPLGYSQ